MNRQIITRQTIDREEAELKQLGIDAAAAGEKEKAPPAKTPDDYRDKLMKYIPGESVAFYLMLENTAVGSFANDAGAFQMALWFIFALGILGTIIYLWGISKVRDVRQILITTIAFIVWVFSLGGPFAFIQYHEFFGSVALGFTTFVIPALDQR